MNKHPDDRARSDGRFAPTEGSARDDAARPDQHRHPRQDASSSRSSFGREGSIQRERFPLREREGMPFASPERFGARPATRRDFEGDDRFQGRETTGISDDDDHPFAVAGDFRPGLGRGHAAEQRPAPLAPWDDPPRTSYHDPRGALQHHGYDAHERLEQAGHAGYHTAGRLDPDTRFDRNRLGDEPDFARGVALINPWTNRWSRERPSSSPPNFPHFGDAEHDRLDHRFVPDRGSLGPYVGRGPKGYVRSDERIREELCEMLYLQGYVDIADIEVFVHEGEVTLKGSIRELADKHFVEHLADRVAGVTEVHNELLRQRPNAPDRRPRETQQEATTSTNANANAKSQPRSNVRGTGPSKPS